MFQYGLVLALFPDPFLRNDLVSLSSQTIWRVRDGLELDRLESGSMAYTDVKDSMLGSVCCTVFIPALTTP